MTLSSNREDAFWALVHSGRVSGRTRTILEQRAAPDDPRYEPTALPPDALKTLRAVLARVLPQDAVDLAQRIDRALAAGTGDGWRFADLPPDAEAYRAGLAALDGDAGAGGFAALPDDAKDALLAELAGGRLAPAGGPDGQALQRWFEDLRGQAVMLYTAHPATYARMNYCGFAYGGDGPGKEGFRALGPDARDPWEPAAGDAP